MNLVILQNLQRDLQSLKNSESKNIQFDLHLIGLPQVSKPIVLVQDRKVRKQGTEKDK